MELTKVKKQLVESLFKDGNRITDRVHRHRLKKDELSKNKVIQIGFLIIVLKIGDKLIGFRVITNFIIQKWVTLHIVLEKM